MASQRSTLLSSRECTTGSGPQHWQQILQRQEPSRLPFLSFYQEAAQDVLAGVLESGYQEEEMRTTITRIAVPLAEWRPNVREWGDNTDILEDWFDEGELIAESDDPELKIDEPPAYERALQWMRSVLNPV